jgi:hypothetical protein
LFEVPILGQALSIDGISNLGEGVNKVYNAIANDNPDANTYNLLRDNGFTAIFGNKKGTEYYNYTTVLLGFVCIGKDIYDIKGSEGLVKINPRKANIIKAEKFGLPIEYKLESFGDKVVVTIQESNTKTSTPMILKRYIIDMSKISASTVTFFGVDIKNQKSTLDSIEPKEKEEIGDEMNECDKTNKGKMEILSCRIFYWICNFIDFLRDFQYCLFNTY